MVFFLVFIICLFLVFGAYVLATRGSEKRRVRLQQRLAETLLYSSQTDDVEVQLARQELMSEIPALNQLLVRVQAATHIKRMLDQADLRITVTRLVMFSVMAGLLAGLAASMLTMVWPVVAVAGVVAASVPFLHVVWRRRQRLRKFLEHLPDALELMSRALSAGHAFAESMHMIANEMPEPIATEFRKTYEEQNLGLSLKLALENLAARVPLLRPPALHHRDSHPARDGRQSRRDTRKGRAHDSRTLPHHGRPQHADHFVADVGVDSVRAADLRRARRDGDEPRLHERAVERPARASSDRRRARDADYGHVDY